MSHRLNFITGVAMLIVAATLAAFIGLRSPALPEPLAADSDGGTGRREIPSRPAAERRLPVEQKTGVMDAGFGVRIDPQTPDHQELEALAKQVESHALARLDRMTRELQLSVDQQRRIFPKLVQGSQSYHPAMQIVGSGPYLPPADESGALVGDGLAGIEAELDPLQQDELLESSLSDLLLWQEIISNLERQLDQQTGADEGPAQVEPEVVPESSGGGRNLFNLVPSDN